jgi:hypothetical protein
VSKPTEGGENSVVKILSLSAMVKQQNGSRNAFLSLFFFGTRHERQSEKIIFAGLMGKCDVLAQWRSNFAGSTFGFAVESSVDVNLGLRWNFERKTFRKLARGTKFESHCSVP